MDVLSGVRDNWFNVAGSTLLVFAATCSGSAEDNKQKMAMLSQPR
jgi:hypothetical protein